MQYVAAAEAETTCNGACSLLLLRYSSHVIMIIICATRVAVNITRAGIGTPRQCTVLLLQSHRFALV